MYIIFQAQQQNEIEAWLEMDDSCNDFALGIGIQHYEGKGRGIEARKKFEKVTNNSKLCCNL